MRTSRRQTTKPLPADGLVRRSGLTTALALICCMIAGCSTPKNKVILSTYAYGVLPTSGVRPMVGAYDFDVRGVVEGKGCVARAGKITHIGFVGGVEFGHSREAQAVALAATEALAADKENDYLLLTRGLVQDEDWKICAQVYARGIALKKAEP